MIIYTGAFNLFCLIMMAFVIINAFCFTVCGLFKLYRITLHEIESIDYIKEKRAAILRSRK